MFHLSMNSKTENVGASETDDPTKSPRLRRNTTSYSAGIGFLESRYEIGNTIIPWKENTLKAGIDVFVQDSSGRKRRVNDEEFQGQLPTASSGDSDGVSTVVSVHDLGFSAAPTQITNEFREFAAHEGGLLEHIMSVEELRRKLKLKKDPSATVEDSLREKMYKKLAWSKMDDRQYLPIDAFESILSVDSIKSLIKEKLPETTAEDLHGIITNILGNRAKKSRRRILGILILSKCVVHIHQFIEKEIWDDDLPLKQAENTDTGCITQNTGPGVVNTTLLQHWDRVEIDLFYLNQQRLFVPFFDIREGKLCYYMFDRDIRLPWQVYQHKTSGGTGMVQKLQIHPSHHNFKGPQKSVEGPYFALKEIDSIDRDIYRQELSALERSSAQMQKEKHLIKLLLTFQHGEKYYLLFEWADGNLCDFWGKHEVVPTPSVTRWAAEQCLGIANAVKRIHGLATWQKKMREASAGFAGTDEREWGRHGDVKPNNILWFKTYGDDRNLLVVSDLGLTRYHSLLTRSRVKQSHVDGYTSGYRAPEMDMDDLNISQKYDIWSLGCVYLEFCIWYLEGFDAVMRFEDQRWKQDESDITQMSQDKYFNISTDSKERKFIKVKPIVEEWITRLSNLSSCTLFAREVLKLVKTRMLVVSPDDRFSIDKICTELRMIIESLPEPPDQIEESSKNIVCKVEQSLQVKENDSLMTGEVAALTQHAGGNPDTEKVDAVVAMSRSRSLSIRTANGESADEASNGPSVTGGTFLDFQDDLHSEPLVGGYSDRNSLKRSTINSEQQGLESDHDKIETTFNSQDESLLDATTFTTEKPYDSMHTSVVVKKDVAGTERRIGNAELSNFEGLRSWNGEIFEHQQEISRCQHAFGASSSQLRGFTEATSQSKPRIMSASEGPRQSTAKTPIEQSSLHPQRDLAFEAINEQKKGLNVRKRLSSSWAIMKNTFRRA